MAKTTCIIPHKSINNRIKVVLKTPKTEHSNVLTIRYIKAVMNLKKPEI